MAMRMTEKQQIEAEEHGEFIYERGLHILLPKNPDGTLVFGWAEVFDRTDLTPENINALNKIAQASFDKAKGATVETTAIAPIETDLPESYENYSLADLFARPEAQWSL